MEREKIIINAQTLAEKLGGNLIGDDVEIKGISPLDKPDAGSLVPVFAAGREPEAVDAGAACLLVPQSEDFSVKIPVIAVKNVKAALAAAIDIFRPERKRLPKVADGAFVAEDAVLGVNVHIAPGAHIASGAVIGDESVVLSGASVMENAKVGKNCTIHPNAVVYHDCILGDNVILHSCAVIGADGFGYVEHEGHHLKIRQVGRTVIENNVEIGANSCVDRGALGDTVIGEGTKMDNLVQIGHNCLIGKHNIVVSGTGIGGGVRTGDYVIFAGQVGVKDHVDIASRAVFMAKAGIIGDIKEPGVYAGAPCTPKNIAMKNMMVSTDLYNMKKQLNKIAKRLENE